MRGYDDDDDDDDVSGGNNTGEGLESSVRDIKSTIGIRGVFCVSQDGLVEFVVQEDGFSWRNP